MRSVKWSDPCVEPSIERLRVTSEPYLVLEQAKFAKSLFCTIRKSLGAFVDGEWYLKPNVSGDRIKAKIQIDITMVYI